MGSFANPALPRLSPAALLIGRADRLGAARAPPRNTPSSLTLSEVPPRLLCEVATGDVGCRELLALRGHFPVGVAGGAQGRSEEGVGISRNDRAHGQAWQQLLSLSLRGAMSKANDSEANNSEANVSVVNHVCGQHICGQPGRLREQPR